MARITDDITISLTAMDLKRIGRLGGWAPGSYIGTCGDCGGEITGDKRAIQCFVCAAVSTKAALAATKNVDTKAVVPYGQAVTFRNLAQE